jgi:Mrp family chromosome partitioning ATPase
MLTEEQIRQTLDPIMVPGLGRSLDSLNLVRTVNLDDHRIDLEVAATAMNELAQDILRVQIAKELKKLPGVKNVGVTYTDSKPAELNEIKHVIAVMSGKGGVGKSLVSGLIAIGLKRQGYSVGILDADITGPSIPTMFGLKEKPLVCPGGMLPVLSSSGIAIMSINLVLANEDDAVIWRGPLIAKAINQFWEEVFWGRLDYIVVDLPPGTADAPLTVLQNLPVSGIIIVSTPQGLTSMVVRKAVNMARQMGKPILGVVENMSYLYIPEIDKKIELFGKSRAMEMAQAAGAPLLGQLPIDLELAKLCDDGAIESYNAEIITNLGKSISQATTGKDLTLE